MNARNLVGVRGWLLLYALTTFAGGILIPVWQIYDGSGAGVWDNLTIEVIRILANSVGLLMIVFVREPVTRTLHIVLNSLVGIELMIYAAIEQAPYLVFGGLVGMLIWVSYWVKSKRVHATYLGGVASV